MNIETRQRIERQIARKAVRNLIGGGYAVTVFDGEEKVLQSSTDPRLIVDAMFGNR